MTCDRYYLQNDASKGENYIEHNIFAMALIYGGMGLTQSSRSVRNSRLSILMMLKSQAGSMQTLFFPVCLASYKFMSATAFSVLMSWTVSG